MGDCAEHVRSGVIQRPQPAWSGACLPPVGTVCAVMDARINIWQAVDEIIGHASLSNCEVAVFRIGDYIAYSPANQFRPILTPEQEREAAIELIRIDLNLDEDHGYIARRVHGAGYRKP